MPKTVTSNGKFPLISIVASLTDKQLLPVETKTPHPTIVGYRNGCSGTVNF